jgi:hypothetical protein
VVEHSPPHPEVKGSSLANAADSGRENMVEKVNCIRAAIARTIVIKLFFVIYMYE